MRCNMKCQKYHELISAFIDNELSMKETLRLKRHLKSCDHCKEEMKIMSKLQYEFQKEGQARIAPQPGEDFSIKVMNIVRTLPVEKKQRRLFPAISPLQTVRNWVSSFGRRPILAYSFTSIVTISVIGLLLYSPFQKDELKTVYELTQADPVIQIEQKEQDGIDHYVREYAINASQAVFGFKDGLIESVNYGSSGK